MRLKGTFKLSLRHNDQNVDEPVEALTDIALAQIAGFGEALDAESHHLQLLEEHVDFVVEGQRLVRPVRQQRIDRHVRGVSLHVVIVWQHEGQQGPSFGMKRMVDVSQQGFGINAAVEDVEAGDEVHVLHLADVVDHRDVFLPQTILHNVRSLGGVDAEHDIVVELEQ